MATVCVRTRVQASADLLWEMLGRFNTLGQWHPMVKRSDTRGTGSGAVRHSRLTDGGIMIERLDHVCNAEHVYRYTVVSSHLPIDQCVSEIRVTDGGNGTSMVEWSGTFVPAGVAPADAISAVRSVYRAGLQNVKRIYESPAE